MALRISAEQHSQYQELGYFVLPHVFTKAEMDALAIEIEQFQRRHEEAVAAKGGSEGISRAGEITFTAFLAENNEAIRMFCKRPEFVSITTQIIGPNVDLYWNQSVFKGPDGSRQFPWHQDDGYTPVTPSPYLTLWLALNDATEENGAISVLPGSNKRGLVPHRQSPIGLICHELDDADQGVVVPVSTGSMAVFQSLTMHKSGVNRSRGTRKAYVIQYSAAGLQNALTGEIMKDRIPIARDGAAC